MNKELLNKLTMDCEEMMNEVIANDNKNTEKVISVVNDTEKLIVEVLNNKFSELAKALKVDKASLGSVKRNITRKQYTKTPKKQTSIKDIVEFTCPVCGKKYSCTKEMYNKLYRGAKHYGYKMLCLSCLKKEMNKTTPPAPGGNKTIPVYAPVNTKLAQEAKELVEKELAKVKEEKVETKKVVEETITSLTPVTTMPTMDGFTPDDTVCDSSAVF